MKKTMVLKSIIFNVVLCGILFGQITTVPLYRVFEREISNHNVYSNNFKDVTLNVQYQAPSGRFYNFYGFYDGNGKGNFKGNIWKIRFMPNELGKWTYVYDWSDSTKGGKGRIAKRSQYKRHLP